MDKYKQPIRNLKGFLTAYFNSPSGQRALERGPDHKGDFGKGNQLAIALYGLTQTK